MNTYFVKHMQTVASVYRQANINLENVCLYLIFAHSFKKIIKKTNEMFLTPLQNDKEIRLHSNYSLIIRLS